MNLDRNVGHIDNRHLMLQLYLAMKVTLTISLLLDLALSQQTPTCLLLTTKIAVLSAAEHRPTVMCYLLNTQSIVNKLDELHHVLYDIKCDCVFITETWLTSYITDGMLDPRHQFKLLRKDRIVGRGGGVCVFVNRSISIVPLSVNSKYDDPEIIGFDFVNVFPVTRVIATYRPPYYDKSAESLANKFVDFLNEYATSKNKQHIIVSDFNLPGISWRNLQWSSDYIHSIIFNFLVRFGYTQFVTFNTRKNNLLDLILCDDEMLIVSVAIEAMLLD